MTVAIARMRVAAVLRIGACLYLVLVGAEVGRELVAGEPPHVVDLRSHDPGSRIWVTYDRPQFAGLDVEQRGHVMERHHRRVLRQQTDGPGWSACCIHGVMVAAKGVILHT